MVTVLAATMTAGCAGSRSSMSAAALVRDGVTSIQRGDAEAGIAAMEKAIEIAPASDEAAFARDTLRDLHGVRMFPERPPDCPASAIRAWHEGEDSFARGDYRAALERFERASAGCPRSATILRALADTHYAIGEYGRSRRMFREAVAIDPWDRASWRYLSDAERNAGDSRAAREAAVMAVLSDPLYEMGWVTLRQNSGLPFRRIPTSKPWVERGEKGPILHIAPVTPVDDDDVSQVLWISYATASSHWDGSTGTRLEAERERVRVTLNVLEKERTKSPAAHSPFWDLVAEARRDGDLDEAIFLLLPDNDLAAEYAAYRDRHRDRLVTYVSTKLAPPFRGLD